MPNPEDWSSMAEFALSIVRAADGECVPRASVAEACHLSAYMFRQHVEPVMIDRSKTRLGQKIGGSGGYYIGDEGSTATFAANCEGMANGALDTAAARLALADGVANTERRKLLVRDAFNERLREKRRDVRAFVKQLDAGKSQFAAVIRGLLPKPSDARAT